MYLDRPRVLPERHDAPPNLQYVLRHRNSVTSSSGSSLSDPDPPSPSGRVKVVPEDDAFDDTDDCEAPWNLVTYNIPWGSSYQGYKAGTLPGPDGPCIFLRSPTPSKKQRTSQACENCRDRKAKCSGDRLACSRCQARGLTCVYSTVVAGDAPTDSPHPAPSRLRLKRAPVPRKGSLPEGQTCAGHGLTRRRSFALDDALLGQLEDPADGCRTACWSPTSALDEALFDISSLFSPVYMESPAGSEEYRFPPLPYPPDSAIAPQSEISNTGSLSLITSDSASVFHNITFHPLSASGDDESMSAQGNSMEQFSVPPVQSAPQLQSMPHATPFFAPPAPYPHSIYVDTEGPFQNPAFTSLAFSDTYTFPF